MKHTTTNITLCWILKWNSYICLLEHGFNYLKFCRSIMKATLLALCCHVQNARKNIGVIKIGLSYCVGLMVLLKFPSKHRRSWIGFLVLLSCAWRETTKLANSFFFKTLLAMNWTIRTLTIFLINKKPVIHG